MFSPYIRSLRNALHAIVCMAVMLCCLSGLMIDRVHSDPLPTDNSTRVSPEISGQTRAESNPSKGNPAVEPSASEIPEDPANRSRSITPVERIRQLNREVVSLYQQGKYDEALRHGLMTCEHARRYVGEEHVEFESCLNNLALIYKATGQYSQAEPLLKQSLEISRKTLGENDPDFVIGLNNLANLYADMGRYNEAEALYLRSLEIIGTNAGEDNSFYVKGLNNLASLYKSMGNYVAVEPLYTKARDILIKISGESQPDYAVVLSNLAHHYCLLGRYSEAETLYRQSLEITRKTLGDQHPQYARTLNNLASLYESWGDYAKAEPFYQQALAVLSSRSGKTSLDVARTLNNLAGLYKTMGDYHKAESFYRQANEIWRSALGQNHPEFATGLNNVADLYYQMGKFKEAEQLYEKAMEIERSSLGEVHPDVALTMQNLAVLHKTMGRYQEAEPLYRRALEIWKSTLGDRHPDVALALHNLGALYQGMGRYTEAEPLYRQALEIRTSTLGEDHPDVATTLANLAALYAATSRESDALVLLNRAQRINDRLIRHVFSIASESQRLGYLRRIRGDMDAYLSLISHYLANSPTAVMDGLDLVLRRKAIVAEAMAVERDAILGGRYPDLEPSLHQLRTLRLQIAQRMMSGPGPEGLEAHRQLLDKWQTEREGLEVTLANKIPEIELERKLMEADRKMVAKMLPEGADLVEFVRFDLFDFKTLPAQGQSPWKPAHYLAFVLSAGEPEKVLMIDLGQADTIDRMISDFRSTITGELERSEGRGLVTKIQPAVHSEAAGKLRAALFDPLLKGLHGIRRLILAPDGNLYRLPFGALPLDPEHCVMDEYRISYVGVGRDVLRFGVIETISPTAPLIAADPDYDLDAGSSAAATALPQTPERPFRDLFRNVPHFGRLPGTRAEGERIAAMLGVQPLMGGVACKGQLARVHSPRILHIATHGFFLPDVERSAGQNDLQSDWPTGPASRKLTPLSRSMENPLLRSGLALTGVNAWLQGKPPSLEAGDGIVTGEDASGLDLLSTELVVLSACETGLGDVKVGEGVFGLRRAFLLAGAKTLVMSLWKVPDAQTQMLMEDFYRRILAGQPRADALREAQLAVKAVFPESFYWAGFVCQGDPGPLSTSQPIN